MGLVNRGFLKETFRLFGVYSSELNDKNNVDPRTLEARRAKIEEMRAKRAEEYITSGKLFIQIDAQIDKYLVQRKGGNNWYEYTRKGYVEIERPDVKLSKNDMPHLQNLFESLKDKYPDLNHIRVSDEGAVIVDTKRNNWLRRSSAPGVGAYGSGGGNFI